MAVVSDCFGRERTTGFIDERDAAMQVRKYEAPGKTRRWIRWRRWLEKREAPIVADVPPVRVQGVYERS